uniref:Uncharacterized protein n=1 Tax=Eptatretus burgeri TaxID=7764 RepID=A0A8C4N993_EPTBU
MPNMNDDIVHPNPEEKRKRNYKLPVLFSDIFYFHRRFCPVYPHPSTFTLFAIFSSLFTYSLSGQSTCCSFNNKKV